MQITNTMAIAAGLPPAAAQLLYRVAYWWPKAAAKFDGKKFIARTREEWCQDTGLSPKQYRTALETLKRKGFVSTTQHKWRGKAVTFMDLTTTIQVGPNGRTHLSPNGPSYPGPNGPTQVVPNGPTLKRHKILTKDTNIKGQRASALDTSVSAFPSETGKKEKQESSPQPPGPPSIHDSCPLKGLSVEKAKSVAALAGLFREKQAVRRESWKNLTVDPERKDTPADLFGIWKQGVGELGLYAGVMSHRDRGIFQHLCRTSPPGSARVVLSQVLQNWSAFKAFLEGNFKAYKVPDRPDTGILYRYADHAVTWWRDSAPPTASEATPPTHPPETPPKAPGASVAVATAPPKTTDEDRFFQLIALGSLTEAVEWWESKYPGVPAPKSPAEAMSC